MGVAIGLGCAEFPFSGAAAYWRSRLLIEQVLPRAETLWPRRPKITTTDR